MKHPITVVVDIRAQVGEGPIWDANTNQLYWVDIMSGMLYCYNPISGKNLGYNVGQHVGTVVTDAGKDLLGWFHNARRSPRSIAELANVLTCVPAITARHSARELLNHLPLHHH